MNGAPTLGQIVRAFKARVTRQINLLRSTPGSSLWQRNYYEHVIRDDTALNRTREYIHTNPARWELDRENPGRRGEDEFDRWLTTATARPAEASGRRSYKDERR